MSDLFPKDVMGESPNQVPELSDQEMQQLASMIANELFAGESREKVIGDLTSNGWGQGAANQFVSEIEYELSQAQAQASHHSSGGGEGMGWLLWIGGILLINLLSYLFNWGFWIY